ncbi:GNAT family N-acetyltransferase [Solimonas marina]|uniref:GNAT family N-acetyltransferase n=1 Tax=Solimonas marina TaxID=2714601 RepID=A0A969W523_9GAMM|nr:GNAT family N-acetyltransferase [Solimonas marina]NKF20831.1 GNAT family N-acetyltransferase [Solimonas marina]
MTTAPPAWALTSPRLRLRHLDRGDEPFVLALLNEPGFIRHIGDRKVRSLDDATRYIEDGVQASYRKHGHGLYAVERREGGETIGLCGLLKREELDAPDVGYAFLSAYEGQGYAREAAAATLTHARDALGYRRVLAIVSPDNERSIHLLQKLGLQSQGTVRMKAHDHDVALYAIEW